ncbi:hypothetical protein BOTBODRAFT_119643 [Botryobasidium botryosum FD-172 SS1]|uniref:Inositol polyphosphate-related phosphatase domain-containing protein n=1 Tax=Botryobasidium botryosum (strain FD-172 SS1) TaxID=930990 RepID=A0A067M7C3_BOTB1|nr:hypothetical protein BOTBODRAFT_119643 [Botryobasidium botryosum FD-172 SS1]
MLEELPDASLCNRRPPWTGHTRAIHVPAHVGVTAISRARVCVGSHVVRVYDTTTAVAPSFSIELKDVGLEWRIKEPRVTAMEFRPTTLREEEGRYLWCGTKDGHLWELDVWTGVITDTKAIAHSAAVTHIFRCGQNMLTLDESGKILVFCGNTAGGSDEMAYMLSTSEGLNSPKVHRISDKQGFVKILKGQLWTSHGPGGIGGSANSHVHGASRGPTIRVYDLASAALGSQFTPMIPLPPDHVGAVTSGTVIISQPERVYLGHEGGNITIWETDSAGTWICVQTVKISASDVVSMEAVANRLWVGSRKGHVSAYDVETKPWTMTNQWQAHDEYPVLKIMLDHQSLDHGQLTVATVGRDEQLRLWDGLLGVDWIDAELLKREASFSTFRNLNVLICSWNIDAAKPESLAGTVENAAFLESVLHSVDAPDIIVFGFQELIDLESRKLTAKTVFLGKHKRGADGPLSDKVSRQYRLWHDRLVLAVRLAMPADSPYSVIHTENLVGLFTCIFVRNTMRSSMRDVSITKVKTGMGGRYGNKGAIVARFVIDDSSICFINCHLAAGQRSKQARNHDAAVILEEKSVFPSATDTEDWIAYVGGGDGSMVLDHEICFLNGDLNYRIDQRRENVIAHLAAGEIGHLLAHDQLLKERSNNPNFRLRHFKEAPITFAPTYKYDRRSSEYDTSEKRRIPAWCDRILYRSRDPNRVEVLHYKRHEANVSDHRPISAGFRVIIKAIDSEARAAVKAQVIEELHANQQGILLQIHDFYAKQLLV